MEQITGSAPSIDAVCLAITVTNTAADTLAAIEQSRLNIIEQSHQFFLTKNKKNK